MTDLEQIKSILKSRGILYDIQLNHKSNSIKYNPELFTYLYIDSVTMVFNKEEELVEVYNPYL